MKRKTTGLIGERLAVDFLSKKEMKLSRLITAVKKGKLT